MPTRPIGDVIASRGFTAVPASATVREVAQMMKKHHTSAVMVVGRKQVLIGICTERDVVIGVVAMDLDPNQIQVAAVMTEHPQTITPDKPFCHALHLMYEGGFHHIPVVDGSGRPLGLLSARDALRLDAIEFESELIQREEITTIL